MATAECVVDAQGRVTRWNQGAQSLLGYPAAEIVGHSAAELMAEPVSKADLLHAVGAEPERWSGELALRHRDGRRVDVVVVAHHGAPGCGPDTWRVVCPLEGRQPLPEDDDLAHWAFDQLPRCSVALYDADLRYRRSNPSMEAVVGLPDDAIRGLRIHDITTQPQTGALADGLRRAVDSGEPCRLESFQRTGGQRRSHAWSVDFAPLKDPDGEVRGVALIAHDITEQYWARKRLVLLNEAASRIGSTLDVAQTARELMEVTVPELADFASVDLLTALESDAEVGEEALHGTVTLRRVAHRFAPGSSPALKTVLEVGVADSYPEFTPPARALASGAGVLSNAEDAEFVEWMRTDSVRAARIREQGYHSMLAVPLRARGATLGVAVFYRRSRQDRMERFDQDDLLLAEELAARAAVAVDNARRYTRERETALSLQRSLLPRRVPEHSAVEVATRYLPAGAQPGIGGDWFDVIPLSGARVALVVGDVVGHGIQASATMGRLRTAVRTLADVDLPPDELLTHLDDLVVRLSAEAEAAPLGRVEAGAGAGAGAGGTATTQPGSAQASSAPAGSAHAGTAQPETTQPSDTQASDTQAGSAQPGSVPAGSAQPAVAQAGSEVGATCCYAVYDPVSRTCTLASAGHPPPVIAPPGGPATVLPISVGPPLGIGGLPFEATVVELAEHSILALYSDGLIETRDRDLDEGLAKLCDVLSVPDRSLDESCDAVLSTLITGRPQDDVALLLTRTRALDAGRVAAWDVASDPVAVSQSRKDVAGRLSAWGLEDLSFATELIVSELVTNAIRYGAPPITLRLIQDNTLICEVSDCSSTAPHLRRARVFDEGGRGLMLVAQFSRSWGTRHTPTGKTIWAEQDLMPTE
ncbi:SpoIIE family protein phosphatase [Catenulispora rubra]|uniref:SpoIIE family protein phosphatase n=1 Tax=Catenulispora rubra TaxID=280293 RepID=UPI0018920A31|nr:SpoIIE family protein phosphatase [Catenulispora rubra]